MSEDTTAFPTLTTSQLASVERYGAREQVSEGNFVFEEGAAQPGFVVVLAGLVSIIRRTEGSTIEIAQHGPGRFLGELNLLTGQRTALAARALVDTTVIRVPTASFRAMMAAETDLSDVIFAALVARREILRAGDGAGAIRIIGSRYSARALELRAFARRQRLTHTWIDVEADANVDVDSLLASVGTAPRDLPVVVTPTAVLRRPTVGSLSAHLGLAYREQTGHIFDLVVVGAGPGGLAAGVYGASEGLDTLILDGVAPGGQAGTSSRIENYFGFASGISGSELVERGALQAIRLGAAIKSPCPVNRIEPTVHGFTLELGDKAHVHARTVIVAVGVQYRKLPIDRLAEFEGAGIYYAATELEAQLCAGDPVVVVGGGNSAGQAAVFLASRNSRVTVVVRGAGLAATMSRYLIDRIEASPNITVAPFTELVALHGDGHLEAVTLRSGSEGGERTTERRCRAVFSFIGAVPHTGWLADRCELDPHGFVLTDVDIPQPAPGHTPLPFETSLPGLFAVGDARHGSMKRVAAAVGEGSSAVRSVHQHLARP